MSNKKRGDWLRIAPTKVESPMATIVEVNENVVAIEKREEVEVKEEIEICDNTISNGKYLCKCGKNVVLTNKEKHLLTKYHLARC